MTLQTHDNEIEAKTPGQSSQSMNDYGDFQIEIYTSIGRFDPLLAVQLAPRSKRNLELEFFSAGCCIQC